MYHFHSLRVNKSGVKLYSGYDLDKKIIQNIYMPYLREIKKIVLKYELSINQTLTGDKENILNIFKKFIKEKVFKFYTNKFNYFLPFVKIIKVEKSTLRPENICYFHATFQIK